MQVTSQAPFPPFAAHASDQQGPFFTLCSSCKLLARPLFYPFTVCKLSTRTLFHPFTVCKLSARSLFHPFTACKLSARGLFHPFTVCKLSARGLFHPFTLCKPWAEESASSLHLLQGYCRSFFSYSPTLPTAGNQLFPFVLYPDYSNPLPSVKGKSPENPKKAPFLLFPRHPHCQNPSIPPAWTQGGLATMTMPQGEKQESRPWKGGGLYFSRWGIWFYAGGLERSTSSEDQNDCTISRASFSSSLLISIRKFFSLPATQRETR